MKTRPALFLLGLLLCGSMAAQPLEKLPNDPHFAPFRVVRAPKPAGPVLRPGDRLAICGDSITEQRRYSQIIETYLTVAVPELNVSTRQFGWSGEQASGFVARITNDVLRFDPTVATTCYGMNDHRYRPYTEEIGRAYRSNSIAMVEAFKGAGTRLILGSPGCMGYNRARRQNTGSAQDSNLSLCQLRNIDIQIAQTEHVGLADVFWPMFRSEWQARQLYGSNYAVAGKDGIHPNWAGHLIMAYAFLKALNVPGEIGVFTVDLKSNKAKVSNGHELVSLNQGVLTVRSFRYPFCAGGATNDDNSIRSGMSLVPFNQFFNRLMLVVKRGKAQNYKITWGNASKTYSAAQLRRGVNLADDFPDNPFSEAFGNVDKAVAAKQAYETRQIKQFFHGKEGKADLEKTVRETEAARSPLVAAIKAAFIPVTHEITITAQ
jgi:lysophospholipase L1-like esterase